MATSTAPPDAKQTKAEILLESGTNELEILVFSLGDGVYGVNVAKVREVILPVEVSSSPEQPESVLGMFNLRSRVLPLVDLHHYFGIKPADVNPKNRRIIVMEFNGQQASFQVESVDQIYRMSWKNVKPVPEASSSQQFAVTGITEIKGQLVLMLDFESVFDHISMQDNLHIDSVENKLGVDRGQCRVLIAEDSNFIRGIIEKVLVNSGYTQVQSFTNGGDAWDTLQAAAGNSESAPDVVVTDIEMPMMDGLALTKAIKTHAQLKHIPVLLFSSLVTDDTRHKGQQVGADEQIAKPQLPELVGYVDKLVQQSSQKKAA